MNRILAQIRQTMADAAAEFLGEDYPGSMEGQGAVFYMNGKNGTEFDWFVNDRLPSFMMFYDDEEKLGAVKAMVYKDGTIFLYVYEDRGRSLKQELSGKTGFEEKELLSLAVLLRTAADDRRIWDADIEKIPSDEAPGPRAAEDFLSHEKYYGEMRIRKMLLSRRAYVSKKITEEGWKAGYICRDEPLNERDSGWSFMAGNEDEAYVNDASNLVLMTIHQFLDLDRDVWKYIHHPAGTRMVRISDSEFDFDAPEKEIFMAKREKN